MIRSRIRPNRYEIRRIAENLKRLKEPQVALTEVPEFGSSLFQGEEAPRTAAAPPDGTIPPPPPQLPQRFTSVEALQDAAASGEDTVPVRFFEQTAGSASSTFLQALPDTDAETAEGAEGERGSVMEVATGMDKVLRTVRDMPKQHAFLLQKLTMAMLWASKPSESARREVFSWLQKFTATPELLRFMSPYGWKFLWALETATIPSYRARLIGNLMVGAGAEMDEEQEIAYIGGLFWNEAPGEAKERWQKLIQRCPTPAVYNVGIRMLSLEKTPEKAMEVMEGMIENLGYAEHKSWIPIVLSYNHTYQSKKAWEAFEELKKWADLNGEPITARQLDDIAMSFLDNQEPEMGLKVYKQMVFSGLSAADRLQTKTYQNLSSAVQAAQDKADSLENLNELSLDAIQNLPPKVADKYFYGGWMKNLMWMGRTDLAAYLVRRVMRERGVRPDSIHYNWLIQGYLEEDKTEAAEEICNEMVHLHLHKIGRTSARLEKRGASGPPQTDWAPATIQTFSILINYFARRHQMDRVLYYVSIMQDCDIMANSYIMNHMLYALFRRNEMLRVENTFKSMIKPGAVVPPDTESFLIVWTAMYKRYTLNKRKEPIFFTPRDLFKYTLRRLPKRPDPDDVAYQQDEDKRLRIWHTMIKSFFLAHDLEGAVWALNAGHKLMGFPIDTTIVRETAFGILRTRPWTPNGEERPKIERRDLVEAVDSLKTLGANIVIGRRKMQKELDSKRVETREAGRIEDLTRLVKKEIGDSFLAFDDVKRAKEDMGLSGRDLGVGV